MIYIVKNTQHYYEMGSTTHYIIISLKVVQMIHIVLKIILKNKLTHIWIKKTYLDAFHITSNVFELSNMYR